MPDAALRKVFEADASTGTLFVFRDLHPFLTSQRPDVIRLMRDCAHRLRGTDNCIILLSPQMKLPTELEKDIATAEYPLPNRHEIELLVDENYQEFRQNPSEFTDAMSEDLRAGLVRACSGLTETELSDALAKGVIEAGGFTSAVIDAIHRTKQEAIRRTRCLEAVQADRGVADVGGLDTFKTWITERHDTWGDEARRFGVDAPRGMLGLGVPGNGKSLSAKVVANMWRLPLLRLDMGAVFGGIVGESEGNLRAAIRIVEALAPCVLWVDELEKGMAGVGSSDRSDGGTAARVFGTFLTWMQEKSAPVFVYASANSIGGVPPELLRKGRFDEIFFFDLPTDDERAEIISIHLRKRRRNPEDFAIRQLVEECPGFVGAEIEQAIKDALVAAWAERAPDISDAHIIKAFQRTVPLVKTQRDKIQTLRQFVEEGRAVRASSGPGLELPEDFWHRSSAIDDRLSV